MCSCRPGFESCCFRWGCFLRQVLESRFATQWDRISILGAENAVDAE